MHAQALRRDAKGYLKGGPMYGQTRRKGHSPTSSRPYARRGAVQMFVSHHTLEPFQFTTSLRAEMKAFPFVFLFRDECLHDKWTARLPEGSERYIKELPSLCHTSDDFGDL
jgi:hypothetical protein